MFGIILNLYFISLLFLLILKNEAIKTLQGTFIFGSTLIILLHIWWGAWVIVRDIKLGGNPTILFLSIIMLLVLVFVPLCIGA